MALAVDLVVDAATFCAVGVILSTLVPSVDAAPAAVDAVLFPAVLLSGTFLPVASTSALARTTDVFPVQHPTRAGSTAFDPRLALGFSRGSVDVMAAWVVAAAAIAVHSFRWEPRR